ncbi:purine-cytosine permease family protein [Nonomuraea jabiensis]|uniref:Purine-cytosine permease-like protein n=1 Tax=Nonomuraea jabiensis TaxID=882448 RepID=A0A7W9LAK3_9ACTN|nr:cytosine permease [Nonomuraea jabiensis]MBB5776711.1 purine-cytosine permease-like protein [Nonomuraea jabiensis]
MDTMTVEQNGINAVPEAERRGRPGDLFWPWAGSNLSLFGVAFGVYMVGLGLGVIPAIITGAVGYALSFLLVGLVAVAGTRSGVPTMTLGRAPFGYQGNKLPAALSYISNVGWEIVLVTLSAQSGAAILARVAPGVPATTATAVCFAVAAVVVIAVGVYGHAMIMAVQRYLTYAFVVLTVVYMALMLPKLGGSLKGGAGPGEWVGGVVFAMTLLGLGWVNCGADYSRYLPANSRARSVALWTTLGGAVPPMVLLVFGVLLAGGDPKLAEAAGGDPVGALAQALPTWFLLPYLLTAIGGFLAGAIMDIYSSGLSMLALGVPVRRHYAVLIDGVLMVLGGYYLLFVSSSFLGTFQAFLAIIGVVMAAWVAIFLVDMWRLRAGGRTYDERLLRPGAPAFNWAGLVSLVVASAVGLGLIKSADPNIARIVGFLMSDEMKAGTFGGANIGVVIALVLAGLLYLLITAFAGRRREA